jgi:UDP-hydrolysing UDP-N-acetyl-D-glucosamine 2-epimerase
VRIAVVVTARPSWAKLFTICEALQHMPDVELQIIACASALLERYGRVIDVIRKQGFTIAAECWSVYEGESTLTSAKETGALLCELSAVLRALSPAGVVVCADRHEVLGAAQAAAYLHIPVMHLQGGERTGSIDDRVRDAVTSLSTVHFPCTDLARWRVYGITGSHAIYNFGCSAVDLAKRAQSEPPVTEDELGGAGAILNLAKPFIICLQHPVTDEADQSHAQMWETLHALPSGLQCVTLWPGQDAGSAGISKAIREYQETYGTLHTVRNLPPSRFLRLLTQCAVLIGNSSAGIRESAYLGVPVVDIGNRQRGRQRAKNVTWVAHEQSAIRQAIARQMAHGKYPSSHLYGSGNAGQQIAEVLRGIAGQRDQRHGVVAGDSAASAATVNPRHSRF